MSQLSKVSGYTEHAVQVPINPVSSQGKQPEFRQSGNLRGYSASQIIAFQTESK